jgi:formate dehydrogenase alpha subunit
MVNLKIDGKNVQIEKGATILAAAEKIGVRIPTLCFLQKVSPTGACRICVVEVAGADKPMTACNTPAVEGMVVTTQSEKLAVIRRQVVELLLVNHPLDCPVCDAGGECDLQNVCYEHDVTRQPFGADDVNHGVINDWPLIKQVPNRCILCEKCVKVCHEVVGASAIVVRERGDRAFIDTHDGKPLNCEFCGNCVDECPTGTLLSKPFQFKARPWELRKTPSVCTYCGSQCQIDVNVKQNKIYRVTSEDGVTVNDGTLCIGGYFGYGYVNSPKRLAQPLLKKGEKQVAVNWDEALTLVADRLRQAGADSVGALGSPRLTNEENYLFQKLFRAAVGTNNIDSEARFGALRALRSSTGRSASRGRATSSGRSARRRQCSSSVPTLRPRRRRSTGRSRRPAASVTASWWSPTCVGSSWSATRKASSSTGPAARCCWPMPWPKSFSRRGWPTKPTCSVLSPTWTSSEVICRLSILKERRWPRGSPAS